MSDLFSLRDEQMERLRPFFPKVERGTALDAMLMLYRVAALLVVGTRLAHTAGWGDADRAGFRFDGVPSPAVASGRRQTSAASRSRRTPLRRTVRRPPTLRCRWRRRRTRWRHTFRRRSPRSRPRSVDTRSGRGRRGRRSDGCSTARCDPFGPASAPSGRTPGVQLHGGRPPASAGRLAGDGFGRARDHVG